jgi:hypothetical protein
VFSFVFSGGFALSCYLSELGCEMWYGAGTKGAAHTYDMVDKKKYMNKFGIAAYT